MSKPTKLKYNGLLSCLNPGDARHTTLTITNLQQGDNGLSPGELFESNGFVKVTKENQPNPIGVSGTAVLGVVTVVIT